MKLSQSLFPAILLVAMLLGRHNTATGQTLPQRTNSGGGISLFSSAAGHGMFIAPYLFLSKGRNEFQFAPLIQVCTKTVRGGRMTYSRNLSGEDPFYYNGEYFSNADLLQLNLITSVQYNSPMALSHKFVAEHTRGKNYEGTDWTRMKLATAEASLGIELRVNFSDMVCLRNHIAFSGYYRPGFKGGSGLEKCGNTLELGTALQFTIQ